jgi:serpin B
MAAGACGGAVVSTAPGTGQSTSSERPTPSASQTASAPATGAPSPLITMGPNGFELAMGKGSISTPEAEDWGAQAATEIDDFGFDLLRRLDAKGNLCVSPTSIALDLAMVRAGARGDTATEMDKVLRSLGAPGQEAEIVALLERLDGITYYEDWPSDDPAVTPEPSQEPLVELDVANAAFAQRGMALEDSYLDDLYASFKAGVGLLDFRNDPETARRLINQWASDRTKGRIPEILQPGDVNSSWRLALANAIYFKAGWAAPFDPKETRARTFARADGSAVSVPTMAIDSLYSYAAGDGWRAVELPYGLGVSMTVVVPDDMAAFVAGLDASQLSRIVDRETTYDVDLTLPRFSAESRIELKPVLTAMGMAAAFDPIQADFSGITGDRSLLIDKVIHQANIDVVEQGTTAAAVTITGMATTGGGDETPPPPPHVKFHVDRPFLYFIRDTASGAVLFMGRIDDPSAAR